MRTRKVLWGVLIAGAIWATLDAALGTIHLASDFFEGLQHPPGLRLGLNSWLTLEGVNTILQKAICLLILTAFLLAPMDIWLRLVRRKITIQRLSATPPSHGKYLPWGRNLRRHASIPARYGGVRPRKTLRPMRGDKSLP